MSGSNPRDLATAAVRALAPYVPGKPIDELERELGISNIVKLASNENPLGPSPAARRAMQEALEDAWLYPDGSGHLLKEALARHLGVAAQGITLGNGSNDVLVLLAEAFLTPHDEAVYSQHCFAVYPIAVQATGARGIAVPALPTNSPMPLGHDLDAMRRAITPRTRLVFIANPNNPTGTWADAGALERFVESVPRTALVVLDEAYFEYARAEGGQDGIEWLGRFPHLVIARTFSKVYGLAGLRVGYAVSDPGVADVLNRVRQPFNVNLVALAGATAALTDAAHVERGVELARDGREQLRDGLMALRVHTLPSIANFVLAHVGPRAPAVYEAMLRRGVIVRPVGNYGLREHLRITVGTAEQNARCIEAMRDSLIEQRR
ncbi:MAG TPA: histidinol-phosphate transaminase [Steroidobacteraceae bacterium]|nr:histidinol-phosphate transaminase [Steroidobacteraceae bacterium]